MDTEVLLTVIVPAYNVCNYIERCLKSILMQTYQNLEIIVIDDGSTDGTSALIDSLAETDKRIVPVHQENAGLIEVRERGINLAHGLYTGFVDGDDEIERDMYERLLCNAVKHDADISQCGILYCFKDGRTKPMHGTGKFAVYNKTEGLLELLKGTHFEPSLCNKIYKTEILKNSCPDKSIVNNEDFLRNSVLFSRSETNVYEDFCGYHYWRREDSMSNNKNAVKIGTNIIRARKLILDSVPTEVRNAALESYIVAITSIYNKLIFRDTPESAALSSHCRSELSKYKKEMANISKGIRMRAYAIQTVPLLYDVAYRFHNYRKKNRIRKQAARIRRQAKQEKK